METFLRDLKQSLRMFLQRPDFTITAVVALALGIGANTAVFSVVDTVLLRPAPYPEPERLVAFSNTHSGSRDSDYRTDYLASIMKFILWRQQTDAFESVSAYRYGVVSLTATAYPEQLQSATVSVDYFRAFGSLRMALGRTFTDDEERQNGPRVAVLSDALWKRRFGGDPHAIGATISLSGEPYEIIGIAAPGARTEKDPPTEVWMPLQIDPESLDQNHFLTAVGRLKPGVTLSMAKAKLQIAAGQLRRRFPAVMNAQAGFTVLPIRDFVVGDVGASLWILLGAVSLVLLIACSNVANLLLTRATTRKREIAIRAAMGAGRGRITRQLLTESIVLSVAGAAVGLAIGMLGVHALLALNPGNIPRVGDHGSAVHLDWRILAFTISASLSTGVLFGLIPALQLARADLSSTLKESGGASGTGSRQKKTRSLLVVGEIAMAVVLLIGAGLLIRTFAALRAVTPGFDARDVLVAKMSLADQRFKKTANVARLVLDGLSSLDTIPGVVVAGGACCVPLEGDGFLSVTVVGRPLDDPNHGSAGWTSVSAEYFNIFKIPLLRGRSFTDRDNGEAPGVVIINQAMASKFWPQGDPLRDRIFIAKGAGPLLEEPARQVIGIVGDVRDVGLNRDPRPTMWRAPLPATRAPIRCAFPVEICERERSSARGKIWSRSALDDIRCALIPHRAQRIRDALIAP
ncbi:MAG TPA: ABC transporter permease [Bryobacteraceae bacterium]